MHYEAIHRKVHLVKKLHLKQIQSEARSLTFPAQRAHEWRGADDIFMNEVCTLAAPT